MGGGRKWATFGLCGALSCATGADNDPEVMPSTLGEPTGSGTGVGTDVGASTSSDPEASTSDATFADASTTAAATGSTAAASTGAECMAGADCPSGFCSAGSCESVSSCADLLAKDPAAVSGAYEIDPLGVGMPYAVYCDMVTDGGGWTLVMKLASGTNTFAYGASAWTSTDVVNPDDATPNDAAAGTNAKLPSFNDVPGSTLRLEWVEPSLVGQAFVFDALAGRTALELFSGGEVVVAGDESSACNGEALVAAPGYASSAMRHGQGAQFYGVNGNDDGEDLMRFGFGSNDEDYNPWGPKQGIGAPDESVTWGSHDDCNNCGCYGNAFEAEQVSANLWLR
jgi:hypothetical protein